MKVRVIKATKTGNATLNSRQEGQTFPSLLDLSILLRKNHSLADEVLEVGNMFQFLYKRGSGRHNWEGVATYAYEFVKEEPVSKRKFVVAQPAPEPVEEPTEFFFQQNGECVGWYARKGSTVAKIAEISPQARYRGKAWMELFVIQSLVAEELGLDLNSAGHFMHN